MQDDVCNGCGYCVVSCPFGVIDRRPEPLPNAGGAFKCTFCYDRQKSGLVPACAKVCPTESIVFGRLDDLRARAAEKGAATANKTDTTTRNFTIRWRHRVRGIHAFFLILGEPEAYGLPPKPQVPTIYLKSAWTAAFATAIASLIATLLAFAFFILMNTPHQNSGSNNCARKPGRKELFPVAASTLSVGRFRENPVTTVSRW